MDNKVGSKLRKNWEDNQKLYIFTGVFFLGYLAYVILHYILRAKGLSYPHGSFLFYPSDRFKDFVNINNAVAELNPYLTGLSNYPPLILLFAYIFACMGDYTPYEFPDFMPAFKDPAILRSLYIFLGLYVVAMIAVCVFYAIKYRGERKLSMSIIFALGVGAMLVVSAPSLFAIDRANYILPAIVLYLFWAIFENEYPESNAGAVFVGLVAAIKIYPVFILGWYFFEKKWKKCIAMCLTGMASVIIPAMFFVGPLHTNLIAFAKGAFAFGGSGTGFYFLYFNVGCTGMIGYIYRAMGQMPDSDVIQKCWLISGVVLALLVMFLCKYEKATWKKLLALTALMIYLTPNAYLYCSAFLTAPILVMVLAKHKITKFDISYIVLSALLMVPKAYFYLPDCPPYTSPQEYNTLNCAVFLDGLLLLIVVLLFIGEGIYNFIKARKVAK